jgi:hypothetical protein
MYVIENNDGLFIREAIFKNGSRILDIGSGISKCPKHGLEGVVITQNRK